MAHVIAYKEKIYPDRMAGGGGSSEAIVIFDTFTSTTGEITLSDDITNYTDLEFYIKSSSDGTTMVYRVNVQEFMREFPNVASPNERTPHFLPTIWSQSGCYSRIITGTANNKLLVYQCSSQGVDKIVGINYGGGSGGTSVIDYSTDEQDTGAKWIDGKTIYQKTYDLGNVVETPSSQWTNLNIDATNISRIINSEALGEDGTYWQTISVRCNQNALGIYNDRSGTIYVKYLTIRYIKVND